MQAKGVTPVLSWTALRRAKRAAGKTSSQIGRVLVAEDAKHGVQVSVHTFHRVRLGVVCWREGESDTCSSESFLHHLGPEIRGVVGVYLQWVAEPRIQHL